MLPVLLLACFVVSRGCWCRLVRIHIVHKNASSYRFLFSLLNNTKEDKLNRKLIQEVTIFCRAPLEGEIIVPREHHYHPRNILLSYNEISFFFKSNLIITPSYLFSENKCFERMRNIGFEEERFSYHHKDFCFLYRIDILSCSKIDARTVFI